MTNFSDFKTQIAEYANRQDWSDALVTGFVRQAEQKFNAELRVDRMIQTDQGIISGSSGGGSSAYGMGEYGLGPYSQGGSGSGEHNAMLPDDWLEMDFVSIANVGMPSGWMPIRYLARDHFFNTSSKWTYGFYTIEGRIITFGGPADVIDGIDYRLSYYGEVPVFSDTTDSWIYTKYPSLYLSAALMIAFLHAVGEEDKAVGAKQLTEDMIQKLNVVHLHAKASGSRITRARTRSFG